MTATGKRTLAGCIGCLGLLVCAGAAAAETLTQRLVAEDRAVLAADARRDGDAQRGAIVFHQPHLACATCHRVFEGGQNEARSLGPDLSRIDQRTTDITLIESVLEPSKVIRPEYAALAVDAADGRSFTGLPAGETADELLLRDPTRPDKVVTIRKQEIAERRTLTQSLMPTGQVDQLASRQQFLDLVRYLIEIRDGGPARARQLQPSPQLVAPALPPYEQHVDHAGMIAALDKKSYDRGAAIYNRLCINCHGTPTQPGSLPTSLRFASDKFKNGNDPYTMYQTLTRGFGLMAPQTWMVPRQKYDVIHYIREEYLHKHNRSQYLPITPEYLASLPVGNTTGPEAVIIEPWVTMDYGPSLINLYEIGNDRSNLAPKGIAVRLDPGPGGVTRGNAWMVFEHDTLRIAAGWSGQQFIDFEGIHFNGRHGVWPRIVGRVGLANPTRPGWGRPADGAFADPRPRSGDDRPYGPLPRSWGHYRGLYHHGSQAVISYNVGSAEILEMPGLAAVAPQPVFTRTLNVGPRMQELVVQIARHPGAAAQLRGVDARGSEHLPTAESVIVVLGTAAPAEPTIVAGIVPSVAGARWQSDPAGNLRLRIPAGQEPLRFTVWTAQVDKAEALSAVTSVAIAEPARDLTTLTHGGPPRWPQKLVTRPVIGRSGGPLVVDVLAEPADNPWLAQLRLTGFDFLPGGSQAAVCTWDGDVWLVGDLTRAEAGLTWQRIASGLFQPLGLKVVAGKIYVGCRDQIVLLHDLNGDGETDFYENFNSDHQVTEHFHEFAMGLQTDAAGNFYYAKAARHALSAVVPQHGTLLRVSQDGSRTDILATGFRAPNGVCLNPDGTFFLTDQEGHWTPKNRINWVRTGRFYGNMLGSHDRTDTADTAMEPPICWITNSFDRSPSEPLWVTSPRWKPLAGSLLNFSYGYGKMFVVLHEKIGDQMQGGMVALPLSDFPTGIMRGRFHPDDGQLYVAGMHAWAGNATKPGGFYRVRYTGGPLYVPVGLSARKTGLAITFSDPLDPKTATKGNFAVKVWDIKRTANYGSPHFAEHPLALSKASLSADGKTVTLALPEIAPTRCMEIKYDLHGAGPANPPVQGTIHNTIHSLP